MGLYNPFSINRMGAVNNSTDDQKFFEAIKNAQSIFDQPEDEDGKKENLKIIEELGDKLGQGEPEEDDENEADEEKEEEEKEKKEKTEDDL